MFQQKIEKGQIEGCPYVRFGRGTEKIVVFPLINDALFSASEVDWYFRNLFAGLSRDYRIDVISRKRNLSLGYSTQDMAADYARVFERANFGAAHVIGISLGGMVAQRFAHDYPHYVKRLVLVSSAQRMGPEGLNIARRWIPWTKKGMWREIYEETVRISFHKCYRFILPFAESVVASYLRKNVTTERANDFIIAGQAGVLHDSTDLLAKLSVPVLVLSGTEDTFFPEALFQEMIEKIPDSERVSFQGARHLVLDEDKRKGIQAITAFLKR
ncbi:MAG TPA: alpha/beta hydrolase [Candidatus Omnitrophota bacterium]|nr:alpha/beta hydrolase [Candidatus Omnitrophota bacterium]